jgi:hypothetical protein
MSIGRGEVLAHLAAGSAELESGTPSEAEYQQIRPFLLDPIPREALYRRHMVMANDALDRRFQEMPRPYMARLGETLVGKALLMQHNDERTPVGLWYAAQVRKSRAGEVGDHSLEGSFYLARGKRSDEIIADIDAGVLRYGSLGFAFDKRICSICELDWRYCPHRPGEVVEDGRKVVLRWGGDLSVYESHEGSLVTLGCVRGAQIVRQAYLDQGDTMEGLDKILARLDALEGRSKPADPPVDAQLAADGKAWREHMLSELARIGKLIGSEAESAALAAALSDAPVARIKPVLDGYVEKLNQKFPPTPIGDPSTGAGDPEPVVASRRAVKV